MTKKRKLIKHLIENYHEYCHEHNHEIDTSKLKTKAQIGAQILVSQLAGDVDSSSNLACASASSQFAYLERLAQLKGYSVHDCVNNDRAIHLALNEVFKHFCFDDNDEWNHAINYIQSAEYRQKNGTYTDFTQGTTAGTQWNPATDH